MAVHEPIWGFRTKLLSEVLLQRHALLGMLIHQFAESTKYPRERGSGVGKTYGRLI